MRQLSFFNLDEFAQVDGEPEQNGFDAFPGKATEGDRGDHSDHEDEDFPAENPPLIAALEKSLRVVPPPGTVETIHPPSGNHGGHPFASGTLLSSPGGHFTYRVIGPCCRLFDREELPWPCCRLQWRSKEPSWRRIGRRFVLDMATRQSPSYSVEIVEAGYPSEAIAMTLYAYKLSEPLKSWWYSKIRATPSPILP